jgi:hypothetical protein
MFLAHLLKVSWCKVLGVYYKKLSAINVHAEIILSIKSDLGVLSVASIDSDLGILSWYFKTLMEPRNRFHVIDSAGLFSLAGRYDNPIPTQFLAPIDCLKITALLVDVLYST